VDDWYVKDENNLIFIEENPMCNVTIKNKLFYLFCCLSTFCILS